MIVKPWIAALIVISSLAAVAGYAYRQSGLPVACYKDSQQITASPGGTNKLIAYEWHCQKNLFGINFGSFGRPAIGFEVVAKGRSVPRRGFPPPLMLRYKESSRSKQDTEIPPRFRVMWKNAANIQVVHDSDSEPFGIPWIRSYHFSFRVDPRLPAFGASSKN